MSSSGRSIGWRAPTCRRSISLLVAAGFAPGWRERSLGTPELAEVSNALDYMLSQQEPYPAVVVDRHWNLLRSNGAAGRFVEFFLGHTPPGTALNLADALVAPDVLRRYLVNWVEVVRHFVRTVEADAAADGSPESSALLERLMRYDGVRAAVHEASVSAGTTPVLPMHFRKDHVSLRLFTTIATLGTPHDITAQELRIECFFPLDDPSAVFLRRWASASQPPR